MLFVCQQDELEVWLYVELPGTYDDRILLRGRARVAGLRLERGLMVLARGRNDRHIEAMMRCAACLVGIRECRERRQNSDTVLGKINPPGFDRYTKMKKVCRTGKTKTDRIFLVSPATQGQLAIGDLVQVLS